MIALRTSVISLYEASDILPRPVVPRAISCAAETSWW